MLNNQPIGIFDSGIGGISVFRKIKELMPRENLLYLADQANMPYGSKSLETVLDYAKAITVFLLAKGCKIIVIACNTACAAALHPLREIFPDVVFVGMEPAVKPAAEFTKTGAVGILATEGTFKGDPYAGVVKRFAQGVDVYEQPCYGLAEAVEHGQSDDEIMQILESLIAPLKEKKIDQLALACTHYPLVFDLICRVAGDDINVIDPAEAIARRVFSLLSESELLADNGNDRGFYTTTSTVKKLPTIIKNEFTDIKYCTWKGNACLEECY